jgi:hypothetical protein
MMAGLYKQIGGGGVACDVRSYDRRREGRVDVRVSGMDGQTLVTAPNSCM